jgi:hypothetical protein
MSQRSRIAAAATVLVAALSLAAPPSSHAAGLRPGRLPAIPAWDRAWNWLAGLLPAGVSPQPRDRQEKDGTLVSPSEPPSPTPTTTQGSMIDPDGRR